MPRYVQIQLVHGPLWIYLQMHAIQILLRAETPSEDAEVDNEEILDSDDYVGQCLLETAAYLSISAGRRVSVAMTVNRLREEIKSDVSYKYILQVVDGKVNIVKFEGKLSVYNYHRYYLTVSPEGLILFKGSRFLVPDALRPGLLRALPCWSWEHDSKGKRGLFVAWIEASYREHKSKLSCLSQKCPSIPKQPSMGVFKTNYAYEALAMDHFLLRGVEYLAIADKHSGMLSVHCTKHRGANVVIRILRVHCQRQGIPRIIFTDGSSIFCAQEMKDFFKRFDIEHRVSSVSNPHANLRSEVSVKILKRMLRDIVGNSGSLDSDAVTEAVTEACKYKV